MSDEKNTNDQFAEEAAQRSEVAREIEISAKAGDAIAEQNEQRQETEDYLPQEGLFDKMTSDLVKGERPSYAEMQEKVRADIENQPEEQKQDGQTQGGQKL